MANQIKMATKESIYGLFDKGWSRRRIARELGLDRGTVRDYIRLRDSKPAILPTGTGEANPAISPAGPEEAKPAILPAGIGLPSGSGRQSQCRPQHDAIKNGVEAGLTAQRIYQDLYLEHGFCGSYDSVRREVVGREPARTRNAK